MVDKIYCDTCIYHTKTYSTNYETEIETTHHKCSYNKEDFRTPLNKIDWNSVPYCEDENEDLDCKNYKFKPKPTIKPKWWKFWVK